MPKSPRTNPPRERKLPRVDPPRGGIAVGYTAHEVAEALGLAESRILTWTEGGLLDPARDSRGEPIYSFQDVAVLREARELLAARVPARRVGSALRALREQLPSGQPLSAVRISAQGRRILARDADRVWEPDSGQLLIDLGETSSSSRARTLVVTTPPGVHDTVPDDPSAAADQWYDRGLDLEATSAAAAEAAYEHALELDPAHADAHVNLGRLLHERGDLGLAEEHYRAASAADPGGASARYNLGVVLEDQQRVDEAISAYHEALALDEALAAAHFNLARLYEAAGQDAVALGHLAAYKRLRDAEGDRAAD